MDAATAQSLVAHINGNSSRFSAFVMKFSERTWVILCDAKAPKTAPCEEPILDVAEFLKRLADRSPRNIELQGLLQIWMRSFAEEKAAAWASNSSSARLPGPSRATDSKMQRL
jgi:hypothetical protein